MKKTSFNQDWVFYPDGSESLKRSVTLPHDAMLERERVPKLKSVSFTTFMGHLQAVIRSTNEKGNICVRFMCS